MNNKQVSRKFGGPRIWIEGIRWPITPLFNQCSGASHKLLRSMLMSRKVRSLCIQEWVSLRNGSTVDGPYTPILEIPSASCTNSRDAVAHSGGLQAQGWTIRYCRSISLTTTAVRHYPHQAAEAAIYASNSPLNGDQPRSWTRARSSSLQHRLLQRSDR